MSSWLVVRLVRDAAEWDVQLEGHLVRLDRPGAPSLIRRFGSVDEAREAYAGEVAARLAEGFVEATDPALDREARIVHADELLMRGDPIGELITAQHELECLAADADPRHRKRIENRIATITDEHHDRWFGSLERYVRKPSRKGPTIPAVEVAWRLGFVEEAVIRTSPHLALHEAYARLRELPLSRQIRKLVIGKPDAGIDSAFIYVAPETRGASYATLWQAMLEHGIPSRMTELVIGQDQAHRRPSLQLGDLRAMIAAAPALEILRVVGGHGELDIASDTLRVLELHDVVDADLARLEHASLPQLEQLVMYARTPVAHLDMIEQFPRLTHVALHGFCRAASSASLLDYFAASAANRLRTLVLQACQLTDRDAGIVVRNPDRFAHLARLDVRHNQISRYIGGLAKQALPSLRYR